MTSIISRISNYLTRETTGYNKNPNLNSEVFAYALTIILLNITAIGGFILFSWLLGTLKATLLIWLAFYPLRILSGGRHQTGQVTCWVLTVTVFTALGYLVSHAAPYTIQFASLIEASGFIFALYAVIVYAPVTIASKKFRPRKKNLLKTAAIVLIIFWGSIVFNPTAIAAGLDPICPLAITAGLVAQSFSIIPLSFAKRNNLAGGRTKN